LHKKIKALFLEVFSFWDLHILRGTFQRASRKNMDFSFGVQGRAETGSKTGLQRENFFPWWYIVLKQKKAHSPVSGLSFDIWVGRSTMARGGCKIGNVWPSRVRGSEISL